MIAKEIEMSGIPVVQITNMKVVADSVGIKRQQFSPSIIYPTGNPNIPPDDEKGERKQLVREALDKLLQ